MLAQILLYQVLTGPHLKGLRGEKTLRKLWMKPDKLQRTDACLIEQHKGTPEKEACFICDMNLQSEGPHEASTFSIDRRAHKRALQLQDQTLLAKLSAGDSVAQEAKSHARCLVSLSKSGTRKLGLPLLN